MPILRGLTVHISHHGLISSLISSLSSLPKDLGFDFFFLTSLWGPGFFPADSVENPDPPLMWWPVLERQARLTGSKAEASRRGNRALHMLGLERGLGLSSFNTLLSLKTSVPSRTAVQSGHALPTRGHVGRTPDTTRKPKRECACLHTRKKGGKKESQMVADRHRPVKPANC